MARRVDGQILACELRGERTRGRRIGVCRLDARDVGAEVIAAGLARACNRFNKGRYAGLEAAAARRLPLPDNCEPRSWPASRSSGSTC